MAERLSPPLQLVALPVQTKTAELLLCWLRCRGSAGGRFCLLTLPHAWLTGSSPGPAALAAVLCVALGAPAAPAAGSSPRATGQRRARPRAALAGRLGRAFLDAFPRHRHQIGTLPRDERGQVTTSSTTSRQGSSTEMVNLPFPVRIRLERVASSAIAGEKVALGKTPFNHTQHMLKVSW